MAVTGEETESGVCVCVIMCVCVCDHAPKHTLSPMLARLLASFSYHEVPWPGEQQSSFRSPERAQSTSHNASTLKGGKKPNTKLSKTMAAVPSETSSTQQSATDNGMQHTNGL